MDLNEQYTKSNDEHTASFFSLSEAFFFGRLNEGDF